MVDTAAAVGSADSAEPVPVLDWWYASGGDPHLGEHLHISERVVVAPAGGQFAPAPGLAAHVSGWSSGAPENVRRLRRRGPATSGPPIASGDVVGTVGGVEVRSPFAGTIAGLLVRPGEKVSTSQPLAWLRAPSPAEGFD